MVPKPWRVAHGPHEGWETPRADKIRMTPPVPDQCKRIPFLTSNSPSKPEKSEQGLSKKVGLGVLNPSHAPRLEDPPYPPS